MTNCEDCNNGFCSLKGSKSVQNIPCSVKQHNDNERIKLIEYIDSRIASLLLDIGSSKLAQKGKSGKVKNPQIKQVIGRIRELRAIRYTICFNKIEQFTKKNREENVLKKEQNSKQKLYDPLEKFP